MLMALSKNPILRHIQKKTLVTNQDYKTIFTGECGEGKSYGAMRLAELIDPTFNIDRVVFHAEEFLKLMNRKDLKKGSVIIWDEASVSLDARDFQTIFNKLLNNILVTMRYKNYVLIFTVPSADFIDKRARHLLDSLIDLRKVDHKNKKSYAKFYVYKHYHAFGKTYLKAPVMIINGEPKITGSVRFSLPSEPLRVAYEKKKKEFGDNLTKETLNGIRELLKKPYIRDENSPQEIKLRKDQAIFEGKRIHI